MKIEENKDLFKFNTYKLNAKTKYFLELKKEKDFLDFFKLYSDEKIKKFFILGEGSNSIFIAKKYNGWIIKISNNFIDWKSKNKVEVGAGKNWDNFLLNCQKKGFYDIQSMSSIPGSIGAGAFGNIGAFGQEIKNYILEVKVLDLKSGKIKKLNYKKMNFSYRSSLIKENFNEYIIYSVIFDFSQKFKKERKKFYFEDEYYSIKDFLKKNSLEKTKREEIRRVIKKIRKNTYPDINKYPNVGSTFKNIQCSKIQFKKIQKKYPEIPFWELDDGKIKIPTAYIFDKILKLNGKEFNQIKICKNKPLFLINKGFATGKEFYALVQKIKKLVKKELDLDLEEEVRFIK